MYVVVVEYIQNDLTIQVSNSRILNYLKPEIVHHERSATDNVVEVDCQGCIR
jgi:hypothetical protein